MEATPALTPENYASGMLIDDELMGAIAEEKSEGGVTYAAFILSHETGEYVGYQQFSALNDALQALNQVQRAWKFESTSDCGVDCSKGSCGNNASGKCRIGGCGKSSGA